MKRWFVWLMRWITLIMPGVPEIDLRAVLLTQPEPAEPKEIDDLDEEFKRLEDEVLKRDDPSEWNRRQVEKSFAARGLQGYALGYAMMSHSLSYQAAMEAERERARDQAQHVAALERLQRNTFPGLGAKPGPYRG